MTLIDALIVQAGDLLKQVRHRLSLACRCYAAGLHFPVRFEPAATPSSLPRSSAHHPRSLSSPTRNM
eukprot:CAMPEP_0118868104 /NCGR_PEP_ID=MMETSP1163-20130328/11566_1 /TAXON_ID=124430 /ORGANISM="Phaeomonas parva, Strain CCMP2877" /LENGTH=66 /DNA_ID=CAMNT_0006802675 /DNA_START=1 /DNA_END=201 /DNA_ORIENTATION=-